MSYDNMSFRTKIHRIGYTGTSRQVFLSRYVAVIDVFVFIFWSGSTLLVVRPTRKFNQQNHKAALVFSTVDLKSLTQLILVIKRSLEFG
jgi:hypothetical protein